ncbi:hypothetical protein D6789_04880 [Candidatus Woesearchaeota archaeon]|nr:MAG: hypothetical protein D6789_04880 [Candidatus Woesearchaeota archaeon]
MGAVRNSIIIFVIAFTLGLWAAQAYETVTAAFTAPVYDDSYEFPTNVYSAFTGSAIARPTPSDHLTRADIDVRKERVVLDIQDAIVARFTPTNSMDPVFDEKANALEVVPRSEADIDVGDIVAYTNEHTEGTIIHRIIKKGEDERGTYYIVRGDNNARADPYKVRFSDIKSVVVAIVY